MAIERAPGRRCGEVIGYPRGCAGLVSDPLERCRAELRGNSCLLCVKSGDTPMPVEIDDRGWMVIGKQTVQAIKSSRHPGRWVVAVFCGGRLVDPRYPPILVNTKGEAIELAKARARQIEPRAPMVGERDEEWACGRVKIMVCEPVA